MTAAKWVRNRVERVYHSTISSLGGDNLKIEPDTIRPTVRQIDDMTSEELRDYIGELGLVNARVTLRRKGERRTGHLLSKHPHKYSLVPPAVAAAFALTFDPDHNVTRYTREATFVKLAKAQPQNAARMFARERSLLDIHTSDEMTVDTCEDLMAYWAYRFDNTEALSGFEREACLSAGCEVFASLLDAQDFSLDDLQLANVLNNLQAVPDEYKDFPINVNLGAPSPQEQRDEQRTRGRNAYGTEIFPKMLPNMIPFGNMFTELLERPLDTNAYAACIVGMVAGGIALRSQEKGSSAKDKGDHAVAFLGLVGAIAGFFPPAAGPAGLTVFVGSSLINHAAGHEQRRQKQSERIARRFANAMIFERGDDLDAATTEFGDIVLAALNGVTNAA